MAGLVLRGDATQRFWAWFERKSDSIARSGPKNLLLVYQITWRLRRIHRGLCWEITPSQFCVSANGYRALIPLVESVVSAAPVIPGWTIVAFRQPVPGHKVEMAGVVLNAESIRFASTGEGSTLDVCFYLEGLTPENETRLVGAAFIVLDNEIGEYNIATKIREITFDNLLAAPHGHQPVSELATRLSS